MATVFGDLQLPTDKASSGSANRILSRRGGVVFASAIGASMGLSQTFLSIFGIVMVPISEEFGWSRTLVAGAMSLTYIKSLALALIVGWLLDRYGARRVLLVTMALYPIGLLLFSIAPANVAGFYALFALMCLLGAPMTNTTFHKALAGWFEKGRGAAMGLAAGLGTGAGSALFPLLAGRLIPDYGWRGAFVGIAMVVAFVGFPAALFFFRDPPERDAASATPAGAIPELTGHTLPEVLRTGLFWRLALSIGLCAGCMTALFSQVVPVAAEQGFTLQQAVTAMSVFAVVCAMAQWLIGALLDRFSRPAIMVPFYIIGAAGMWLIHNSDGMNMLLLSAGLMGVSIGAEYSALPLLVSRYFGIAHFGKIACLMYGIVALFMGLIPVAMNAVYDSTGSYVPALTAMEITLLMASVIIATLPSYKKGQAVKPVGGVRHARAANA